MVISVTGASVQAQMFGIAASARSSEWKRWSRRGRVEEAPEEEEEEGEETLEELAPQENRAPVTSTEALPTSRIVYFSLPAT